MLCAFPGAATLASRPKGYTPLHFIARFASRDRRLLPTTLPRLARRLRVAGGPGAEAVRDARGATPAGLLPLRDRGCDALRAALAAPFAACARGVATPSAPPALDDDAVGGDGGDGVVAGKRSVACTVRVPPPDARFEVPAARLELEARRDPSTHGAAAAAANDECHASDADDDEVDGVVLGAFELASLARRAPSAAAKSPGSGGGGAGAADLRVARLGGLRAGASYAVRARLLSDRGASAWSAWTRAPIRVPARPAPPTIIAAEGRSAEVWLTLDPAAGPHKGGGGGARVLCYEIEAVRAGGGCAAPGTRHRGGVTRHPPVRRVAVGGLTDGAPHAFRARAVGLAGPGAWSVPGPQATPGPAPRAPSPAAVRAQTCSGPAAHWPATTAAAAAVTAPN